jgi:hypothetical protein
MAVRATRVTSVAVLAAESTTLDDAAAQFEAVRPRRETCVGPWLPEPIDACADPAVGVERGEPLEPAVVLLLERLSPVELVTSFADGFRIGVGISWVDANGQPSVLLARGKMVLALVTLAASADGIEQLMGNESRQTVGHVRSLTSLCRGHDLFSQFHQAGPFSRAEHHPETVLQDARNVGGLQSAVRLDPVHGLGEYFSAERHPAVPGPERAHRRGGEV